MSATAPTRDLGTAHYALTVSAPAGSRVELMALLEAVDAGELDAPAAVERRRNRA